MCVYIYIYTHTHTHTHIYIYTHIYISNKIFFPTIFGRLGVLIFH